MKPHFILTGILAGAFLLLANPKDIACGQERDVRLSWKLALERELPRLGENNWIVLAESAFPAQVGPGIETVYIGGDQLEAAREVLDQLKSTKHVRPVFYLSSELPRVPEEDAPGMETYRKKLQLVLKGQNVVSQNAHQTIMDDVEKMAKSFRVIVLKTDMKLPYASVFIKLESGYWNEDAEKRLRESLSKPK
jgi:hypothetical protein